MKNEAREGGALLPVYSRSSDCPDAYDFAKEVGDGWVAVVHMTGAGGTSSVTELALTYAPNEPDLLKFLQRRVESLTPSFDEPRAPMTARRRRAVRFGDLENEARRMFAQLAEEHEAIAADANFGTAAPARAVRGELTDEALARLAVRYSQLNSQPNPVEALAAESGWSKSTVRNRLSIARSRGLLGRAGQGRVGGLPTALALEILQSAAAAMSNDAAQARDPLPHRPNPRNPAERP